MTIWEQCLKRATEFPADSSHYGHDTIACAQAAESELDYVYSTLVPELCTRLMKAFQHLEHAHRILECELGPSEDLELELEFIQDLKKPL